MPWVPDRATPIIWSSAASWSRSLAGGVVAIGRQPARLFQYIISIPAIFGASIWLGFLWRRVTKWAVILQVAICLVVYALVPTAFSSLEWAARRPAFLAETAARSVQVVSRATGIDVAPAGRLRSATRSRAREMAPVAIFFDRWRARTRRTGSPKVGLGRFNAEVWIVSWFGVDFSRSSKPQLLAVRFFFSALFPFVLLVAFSYVTPRAPKANLDRFFARVHTPVEPTSEADAAAVDASYADPGRFESDKLFPGTGWEIMKPARGDYIGFFGTWGLVGVILVLLWIMVTVQ
jgi:SSS family solute:Na+ symporter